MAKNKEQQPSTEPTTQEYFFTDYDVTIVATSREEALEKLETYLHNKS